MHRSSPGLDSHDARRPDLLRPGAAGVSTDVGTWGVSAAYRCPVLPWLAPLTTVAGIVMAGLAVYVAWRREAAAGASLSVVLAAAAGWGVGYALELSAHGLAAKGLWGDLKW